ncbi:unnamed protein product [Orchesella dallaii]|uniref:Caspase family p20 domain-containing protein n=1 Tax=Orchesella dallaii TaxID=48710 RepID=A0ABP1QFJ1_9HEXA
MITKRQKMEDKKNGFVEGRIHDSPTISRMVIMDLERSMDFNLHSLEGGNQEDSPDIVVPPLASGSINLSRGHQITQSRMGTVPVASDRECASDSKKLWDFLRPRKRAYKMEEIHVGPIASCFANDDAYSIDHPHRGRCLIFNHIRFDKTQGLSERVGSEVDVKSIQSTFEHLGFQLTTYEDLKFEQMMQELRRVAEEDHSKNDCLSVFILTHGISSELHAYDIVYKPSSLWNLFTADKCTTLAGKPKMFFINACRGHLYDDGTLLKGRVSRTQVDGPSNREHSYRIPNQADFLTVFSTYEGMEVCTAKSIFDIFIS